MLKLSPILLAFLSAALFGAATPASKALLDSFPPFQLAGLLYLGAALGVLPLLLKNGKLLIPWELDQINRLRLLGAILSGGIVGPVFLLLGLQLASAASVSLWLNLELVATAVLGYLFFQDYLGRIGWLGVLGCVFAAGLLSWGEGIAGIKAGVFVALACLGWGLDNHLTALIDGLSPSQSTFWKGIVAGTINLTLGIALQPHLASLNVIGVGLGVGALSYGASIVLYITSAQSLGATRAQMIFSCAPLFGLTFSAITLGETISTLQQIAALLKVGSLLALFQDQHHHEHEHELMYHQHSHRHDDEHHNHTHCEYPSSLFHSHWHEHEVMFHSHPHLPDIHHRHQHYRK